MRWIWDGLNDEIDILSDTRLERRDMWTTHQGDDGMTTQSDDTGW